MAGMAPPFCLCTDGDLLACFVDILRYRSRASVRRIRKVTTLLILQQILAGFDNSGV